jgi:hypothetical protein
MKEEECTANTRDRVRAANSHSKWGWANKMSSNVPIAKDRRRTGTEKQEMSSYPESREI